MCSREGCTARRPAGRGYCTALCTELATEMRKAQRICEAIGPSPVTAELWSTAVALSDTRTELARLEFKVYEAARSVGITDEQWNSIRRD